MKPFSLLRDAVRAKEILTVLVRYGFSNLLTQLNIPTGWIDRFVNKSEHPLSQWERMRLAMEELGPTFVKIGQILSTRSDSLPAPMLESLKQLRDRVTPEPFDTIKLMLERQLGKQIEEVFDDFEEKPVGSGSIAQVHRAVLKNSGDLVALKIQRSGIEKDLTADLEILGWLAREAHDRLEELRPYNLPRVIDQLKRTLLSELDFTREANYGEIFNARNPYEEQVFAPMVYREFTTEKLLVTEYVEGVSPELFEGTTEEKKELARHGGQSVFHQIICNGFFHADPHPGNVLVTQDGRICLIDWGMVGQLTRQMRFNLANLLKGVMARDVEHIAFRGNRMGRHRKPVDNSQLEMDITRVLDRFGPEIKARDSGRIVLELLHVFGINGISLADDYIMLAKAVISIDQTGVILDPEFNIAEVATPFIKDLERERWQPKHVLQKLYWIFSDGFGRMSELPGNIQRVLKRIEDEDISLSLHHKGLDELSDSINRGANRLVLAIIVGALIMGSSMIITTGVQPLLLGFPAIGILGYLISFVFGIWVIFDIIRGGGHK
ncbi:MAG: AarF/UbiB family protein [Verrucomicrobia bacterium]|nr:AarF/UbiB family protein [Verrucomicrobiota bacterium]